MSLGETRPERRPVPRRRNQLPDRAGRHPVDKRSGLAAAIAYRTIPPRRLASPSPGNHELDANSNIAAQDNPVCAVSVMINLAQAVTHNGSARSSPPSALTAGRLET